jgi:hypothetical protein
MGYCYHCRKLAMQVLESKDRDPYSAPARGTGTGRNASILRVTYRLLENIIGLYDDEHYIVDILSDTSDRSCRTFRVVIQGPKMHQNFEGAELPWIDVQDLYERIGDPNLIRTTLSFDNTFTIRYKGEIFTCKLPITIKTLSDMMVFFANPHGGGEVLETREVQVDSEPRISFD